MALLSTLYLEVFVLITCFGLWHKNISGIAEKKTVYRALNIVILIVSHRVLFFVHYHSTILSSKASDTLDNYGTVFYLRFGHLFIFFSRAGIPYDAKRRGWWSSFSGLIFLSQLAGRSCSILMFIDGRPFPHLPDLLSELFKLIKQEFWAMAIPSLLHCRILYPPDCITGPRHHLSHELWQRISSILWVKEMDLLLSSGWPFIISARWINIGFTEFCSRLILAWWCCYCCYYFSSSDPWDRWTLFEKTGYEDPWSWRSTIPAALKGIFHNIITDRRFGQ